MNIRIKVVCLLRAGNRILFAEAVDPGDGKTFLIPCGGGVKFGETLTFAVRREVREELGVEVSGLCQLGMSENFFEFDNKDHHELCFFFTGTPANSALTDQKEVIIKETSGEEFIAKWRSLQELKSCTLEICPERCLDFAEMALS